MELPESIVFPVLGIFETWGSKLSHGTFWISKNVYQIISHSSAIT